MFKTCQYHQFYSALLLKILGFVRLNPHSCTNCILNLYVAGLQIYRCRLLIWVLLEVVTWDWCWEYSMPPFRRCFYKVLPGTEIVAEVQSIQLAVGSILCTKMARANLTYSVCDSSRRLGTWFSRMSFSVKFCCVAKRHWLGLLPIWVLRVAAAVRGCIVVQRHGLGRCWGTFW